MQQINHWPTLVELALPEAIKQTLMAHLTLPFGDEISAKSFWSEYPSTLYIFDELDTTQSLQSLPDTAHQQIEFAITYPEYCDDLGMGYTVKLSITDDYGAGIYVVMHPKCTMPQTLGDIHA
jgi:hypothetical protein